MNTTNCNCRISCLCKSLLASVIIGVVTVVLTYTATIAVTPAFLWVLFGIAIGFLGVALLTSTCCADEGGCCHLLKPFTAGALGTALFAVILLGIEFAATSLLGALITGLLLFFFTLLLTSTTCLIACRCDRN